MANTSVYIPVITPVVTDASLTGDGTIGSPLAVVSGGIVAPGADTQVVFNDGAVLGADAGLTYIKATDVLVVAGGVQLGNAGTLRTDTTTNHTAVFQAYDVDGTAYKTFATLTNANTPSLTISQPSGGVLAFIPPTADPHVVGALWNNAGTLAISEG